MQLGKQHDMVSVLCSDFAASDTLRAVDRLLLRAEADLPNDRRSLFICAECGDLGCGAVTLSIGRMGAKVLWSDLGYEKSYYENHHEEPVLLYTDVGPFEFDSSQYEAALLDAVRQLQPTSGS